MRPWVPPLLLAVAVFAGVAVVAASGRDRAPSGPGPLQVVAAESTWGSIAAELGGAKVSVRSIVASPSIDPHSYEPTAGDARAFATARLAIVNGIGYDAWAGRLLDASPASGRTTIDVGDLLSLGNGENPHQWYAPASVRRVIDAIAAAYGRLDPADAAYFAARKRRFEDVALAPYDRLRAELRRRYAGVPVGYSESIFQPLGDSLGLELATPESFARAVSEGTEISARARRTVDEQARRRLIRVWVYDAQNATPDVQRVNAICRASHIPIVTVTETLSPAGASFEQWQAGELRALLAALRQATGR